MVVVVPLCFDHEVLLNWEVLIVDNFLHFFKETIFNLRLQEFAGLQYIQISELISMHILCVSFKKTRFLIAV